MGGAGRESRVVLFCLFWFRVRFAGTIYFFVARGEVLFVLLLFFFVVFGSAAAGRGRGREGRREGGRGGELELKVSPCAWWRYFRLYI